MMGQMAVGDWRWIALRAVAAFIFGVLALVLPGLTLATLVLGGLFGYVYYHGKAFFPPAVPPTLEQVNTQQIGWSLYTAYMFPFEIASLLLLVAIVGAVVMAKKRI